MLTYYQILDQDYEVIGSYSEFDEARRHYREGYTIRYWDGSNFIYNVTK